MGIVEFLKNTLFPKQCIGCGRLGIYICLVCQKKLKLVDKDVCPYCKRASFFGLTHPICVRRYGLDGLQSIYYYSPLVKKIIKTIKYGLVTDAIGDFAMVTPLSIVNKFSFFKKFGNNFHLIPIPLHTVKLRKRGFNQSTLLAGHLSSLLSFPLNESIVRRIKDTPSQTKQKGAKERYDNIRGAFAIINEARQQIKGSNFIIFDDVWTSGSTIKEVCRIVKKHQAAKVFALTMAR